MQDILKNPYSPEVLFKNFPNLDQQITAYYDHVFDTAPDYHITPRFFNEIGLKIGFRDIFYYIDELYSNKPSSVIDVGCGENIWKRWFPNITGFDPNWNKFSKQDFVDFFDVDFSKGHADQWENGMALNSLHFISWHNINSQLDLAMNIVRSRFLFTFNLQAMDNVPDLTGLELIFKFYEKISKSEYQIILFDAPLLRGIAEKEIKQAAYLNGTVRFILDKAIQ